MRYSRSLGRVLFNDECDAVGGASIQDGRRLIGMEAVTHSAGGTGVHRSTLLSSAPDREEVDRIPHRQPVWRPFTAISFRVQKKKKKKIPPCRAGFEIAIR